MKNNLHKDYRYSCKKVDEPLILEPDDWSIQEWKTIEKIFGMEEAERIVVSDYMLETYGTVRKQITEEQWAKALEHLNTFIIEYASIGWAGQFGLNGVLVPLKKRYEKGERTLELYEAMMQVE